MMVTTVITLIIATILANRMFTMLNNMTVMNPMTTYQWMHLKSMGIQPSLLFQGLSIRLLTIYVTLPFLIPY